MKRGLLMATAAYFSWGLLGPVGKILLEDLPPMSLNAVRMVIATALLVVVIPRPVFAEGLQLLKQPRIVALALLGGGIDFTIYLYALERVDATFATLGFYTAPLWTAVLARPLLGERLGRSFWPASAALLLGGWWALTGSLGFGLDGVDGLGMSLAVLAGLGWALYAVGLRKYAPSLRLRPLMVASFVASTAYFIVLGWILEGPPALGALDGVAWGWMLVHVLLPTTIAMFLFNAALQRSPAGYVNVLVGVELAATVAFSWLLLGDTFTAFQLLGLLLAMIAVSAYLWRRAVTASPA